MPTPDIYTERNIKKNPYVSFFLLSLLIAANTPSEQQQQHNNNIDNFESVRLMRNGTSTQLVLESERKKAAKHV